MRALPVIGWLVFGTVTALARLGETTNEIQVRYGAPAGQDTFLGLPARSYTFNGFNVLVVFNEGKSFIEALKPLEDGRRLEADEAEVMASRIAGCETWTRKNTPDPPGVEFKGTNGAAAMLRRGPQPPDSLVIYSAEAVEKMRKPASQEDEAAKLKLQRQEAINGIPASQCALGKRYLAGQGVDKDESLGRFWLEKAAARGNAEAKDVLKKLNAK
jgi:TPR repeat protein